MAQRARCPDISPMTSIKDRIPRGIGKAIQSVLQESRILLQHSSGVRKARQYANRTCLKLNVGCGAHTKAGWVNIDIAPNVDLTLDARRESPLRDGCASEFYSEHLVEHLEYPVSARVFLSEAFRVLEPGGQFSVGVPDTEWILRDYNGLPYREHAPGEWLKFVIDGHHHPKWCHTPLDHINHHFRQYSEHKYAYDFETLADALKQAGFVNMRQREFDASRDSAARAIGTLYVDAEKPL